ncbi:MAG: malto-oligosyltrehalose synthase [Solirubrobacterales bacterium]|nr:malto-oligosyltrehalose synthase [Solirubrobacterales bacterium]
MSAELRATYRLQLTPEFGFAAACALVPYLRDLGISHLYLSPSLQARAGSTHGYDVVDPGRLSEDLGGAEEFERLAEAARDAGLGIVLDVVPNHMGVDDANRYWSDPALREKFFDVDPVTGRHRRFFDIDDLAGVRQEDPEVFEATHSLLLGLVRDGRVDGLRIDHPDGLADPRGYFERLRSRGARCVWVEKILDPGERLRDWPVSGTVGYEFLNDVCALFVDPTAEEALSELWESVSGDRRAFGEVALQSKLEQINGPFWPDVERLARAGEFGDLEVLGRSLASLPVYRTYVEPWSGRVDAEDRDALDGVDPAVRARMLLSEPAPPEFVTRFQQTTPAVMAKGVEDTAFYRYARLLALNDVGGDPSRFGISVEQFHAANLQRAERFPLGMLTTQTHDAKRSDEVRARIAALSTMPDEWAAAVARWLELTRSLVSADLGAPDDVERYFIFQTLAGAWPIESERIEAYMEKALREAKRNTNWVDQNREWEEAVARFCRELYGCRPFLDDFEPFVAGLAEIGSQFALRQHVLKLTVPGVPDIFQGQELPVRSLVDPDNRRPVDWDFYQASLRRLMGGGTPNAEGVKLFVTLRLLGLRARRPEPFAGSYQPLDAGPGVCAFVRGDEIFVAVAVRSDVDGARCDALGGRWRDVLRGEERFFDRREPVSELLDERGVGVYERVG